MHHVFSILGADPYSRDGRIFEALTQRLMEYVYPLSAGAQILDASCVLPSFLARIAESSSDVTLHVASSMESDARIARFLVPGSDIRITRASSLPWQSGTFDLIVYAECLECLVPAEVSGTLSELRRVLKPSGTLILVTASTKFGNSKPCHKQHFTPESLERSIAPYFQDSTIEGFVHERNGFADVIDTLIENSIYDIKPVRRWFNKKIWPRWIARCDPQDATRLIAVCRK